jgi:hypothetical protein
LQVATFQRAQQRISGQGFNQAGTGLFGKVAVLTIEWIAHDAMANACCNPAKLW